MINVSTDRCTYNNRIFSLLLNQFIMCFLHYFILFIFIKMKFYFFFVIKLPTTHITLQQKIIWLCLIISQHNTTQSITLSAYFNLEKILRTIKIKTLFKWAKENEINRIHVRKDWLFCLVMITMSESNYNKTILTHYSYQMTTQYKNGRIWKNKTEYYHTRKYENQNEKKRKEKERASN